MAKITSMNPNEAQFTPPPGAAAAGKRALEMKKKGHKWGTPVGWKRASQLANKQKLSYNTVKRMKAYFDRHVVDKKGKDWNNKEKPSKGKLAWWGWGGDAGYSWAKGIVRSWEAKKGKEKATTEEVAVHEPKNLKLWEECKAKAIKRFGKWGRYASFYASNLYKKAGGTYNEPKEAAAKTVEDGVYASYPVLNARSITDWAKSSLPGDVKVNGHDLHTTVCYSRVAIDIKKIGRGAPFILPGNNKRKLKLLGSALVIALDDGEARELESKWDEFRRAGATWDFPTFNPHVTIDPDSSLTLAQIKTLPVYNGPIVYGEMSIVPL